MGTNLMNTVGIRTNFPPPLDTLAQLRKNGQNDTLLKRARSKFYTSRINLLLKYTVDKDDILYKMYSHAINCNQILTQRGNKITGKFCNTRSCNVCNRIRTAKMMNGYISQMAKFNYLEFNTLTVPNCKAYELQPVIEEMVRNFVRIKDVYTKKGTKLNGIRKLEVTYNAEKDTYHPHFHLLQDGHYGEEIIAEWLKRYPDANRKGQDCREAKQGNLNEIFKYTTKIVTNDHNGGLMIFSNAINTIMRAMYKKRSIQPYGSIRKVSEDVDNVEAQEYDNIPEYDFMEWGWDDCDWKNMLNTNSLQTLTGYTPPDVEFILIE